MSHFVKYLLAFLCEHNLRRYSSFVSWYNCYSFPYCANPLVELSAEILAGYNPSERLKYPSLHILFYLHVRVQMRSLTFFCFWVPNLYEMTLLLTYTQHLPNSSNWSTHLCIIFDHLCGKVWRAVVIFITSSSSIMYDKLVGV